MNIFNIFKKKDVDVVNYTINNCCYYYNIISIPEYIIQYESEFLNKLNTLKNHIDTIDNNLLNKGRKLISSGFENAEETIYLKEYENNLKIYNKLKILHNGFLLKGFSFSPIENDVDKIYKNIVDNNEKILVWYDVYGIFCNIMYSVQYNTKLRTYLDDLNSHYKYHRANVNTFETLYNTFNKDKNCLNEKDVLNFCEYCGLFNFEYDIEFFVNKIRDNIKERFYSDINEFKYGYISKYPYVFLIINNKLITLKPFYDFEYDIPVEKLERLELFKKLHPKLNIYFYENDFYSMYKEYLILI